MRTAQGKDALPVVGMTVMFIAAVVASAVSWWGWPDLANTLEEVTGPNRTPSLATKETVAAGTPAILLGLAILPWPLFRADRWFERRGACYGGGLSTPEASRRRARGLSIVWCGLAVILLALHVCLVGEMTGHEMPMLEVMAVSFGVFLLALAAAIPYFRHDPASVPAELRATVEGFDRGYRRAVPLLRATAAATIVLGVLWPVVALVVGCVGMCAAMMLSAASGIREG
ncbi:hypothetical protein AB4Z09_25380 [Rhodococcus sp. TAF43]|uniref:hypothetical protein n=1 Tax=Rhodococcus sp. TAF43 TaxID=3237483 RepID=UPI003F9DA254